MNSGVIAARYARALLKFVQETGVGGKVYSQACVLALRMDEILELRDCMQKHPEVTMDRKMSLLETALGEPMAEQLKRFVSLVGEQRRMAFFHRMLWSFIDQYRLQHNIKVGHLVTASPAEGLKERLEAILHEKAGGAEVHLEVVVDPSILGGFVIEIDDMRLDASVAAKFRLLRRELVEINNRIV